MSSPDLPTAAQLREFQAAVEAVARETRAVILSHLAHGFTHDLKPDGSFVTDIDLAVEDLVRSRLADAFPDHAILGEERGGESSGSDFVWVIDPIDGTHSLRHGIPLFGTLLALQHRGRSVVGLIDLPLLDRTFVAAAGQGALRNGRTWRLADVPARNAVPHEIIGTGERRQFVQAGRGAAFDSLMHSHGSVRTYCDCFGHALVIEGCLGAMVDYHLQVWDVAATELIVREAGGRFVQVNTDRASEARDVRYDVVFGKPTVVQWILDALDLEPDVSRPGAAEDGSDLV